MTRPSPPPGRRPAPPHLFLAPAEPGSPPRLLPEELRHARDVLRLGAGDALVGLDGRGARRPLRVRAATRAELELEPTGEAEFEPAPGEPGGPPRVELAVAWPRGGRGEAMLDRLVQLGAAAVTPLVCRWSGPQEGDPGAGRRARLERVARAACKQSRRAWLPELREARRPAGLAGGADGPRLVVLDPAAERPLGEVLAGEEGAWNRTRPVLLAIGPEGGFDGEEQAALAERGARPARLGLHVLRIETAAEAALAVALDAAARQASEARP